MPTKDTPQKKREPVASPRLDRLRARIAEEQERLDAIEASISPEDREEMELRRRLREREEEREEREQEARETALARRLEEAKEAFPGEQLVSLAIDGYPDTFLLKHNRSAFVRWNDEIAKSVHNKRLKRPDIMRRWAVGLVIDWNGQDLSDPMSSGAELDAYLKEHSGIVTAITNAGGELAGVVGKARKS
ncbi:MAG: hypothetical protein RIF41_37065 [Polyangiaceae bacterium]